MGWSESVQGCKIHPTLKQSPGVCSSCLRERLSQLSDSSDKRKTTTIRIGGSYYHTANNNNDNYFSPSHSSSEGCPSPARRHRRNASEAMAFLFRVGGGGGGGGLKKSRSIAVVPRCASLRFGEAVNNRTTSVNNGKKKDGFWSKLIRGATAKRKSNEVVKPSKQTLESRV